MQKISKKENNKVNNKKWIISIITTMFHVLFLSVILRILFYSVLLFIFGNDIFNTNIGPDLGGFYIVAGMIALFGTFSYVIGLLLFIVAIFGLLLILPSVISGIATWKNKRGIKRDCIIKIVVDVIIFINIIFINILSGDSLLAIIIILIPLILSIVSLCIKDE